MNALKQPLGRTIIAAVVGALALTQAPVAWAQPEAPTREELASAKKHYGEGERKYKAGDFVAAEVEFKLANEIKGTPQAERYIGLCEDQQGHFAAAIEWYDRFLAHVPDRMAAQGDEVRSREAAIKALPGKVHIESNPPGASVAVDDKPEAAPTPMDVELSPGPHTIKLTEAGRLPSEQTIDVRFASSLRVTADLDLVPLPPPSPVVEAPPPPPPPPPPQPRSKVPAIVTGVLAIAGAGVGTAFGIVTLSDKSNFDKNPTTQTADNGDSHALICDMAFGIAVTFGVTSLVLLLTTDDAQAPAASSTAAKSSTASANADGNKSPVTLTAAPMVGPHSGGAGMLLRF